MILTHNTELWYPRPSLKEKVPYTDLHTFQLNTRLTDIHTATHRILQPSIFIPAVAGHCKINTSVHRLPSRLCLCSALFTVSPSLSSSYTPFPALLSRFRCVSLSPEWAHSLLSRSEALSNICSRHGWRYFYSWALLGQKAEIVSGLFFFFFFSCFTLNWSRQTNVTGRRPGQHGRTVTGRITAMCASAFGSFQNRS